MESYSIFVEFFKRKKNLKVGIRAIIEAIQAVKKNDYHKRQ